MTLNYLNVFHWSAYLVAYWYSIIPSIFYSLSRHSGFCYFLLGRPESLFVWRYGYQPPIIVDNRSKQSYLKSRESESGNLSRSVSTSKSCSCLLESFFTRLWFLRALRFWKWLYALVWNLYFCGKSFGTVRRLCSIWTGNAQFQEKVQVYM